MFSARFHWDTRPNRLTRLLQEKRTDGKTVLDLTESNPTRAGFRYPTEIVQSLADPRALMYDPQPAGLPAAREAVSRYYAGSGHSVDPVDILLTASTSEAYTYLFKLLCDPGSEVLVPRPSYPLFEFLATMESVHAVQYPLVYHGAWSVDHDALAAAVTKRTRAIILVNPNNPTGSFLKADDLPALFDLCRSRNLALISDEVFADYAFAADPRRVGTLANTTRALAFSMSGLSKAAGLPQLKLGWIAIAGPPGERAEAGEKLEWIADTYLSVATPVQQALPLLLDLGRDVRNQIARRCLENLEFLRASIGPQSPCRVLDVEGGWYATLQVPRIRREEEWALELLSEDNVLVQPGYFYDFESEAFLVLSLLTEPLAFREGSLRVLARTGA
ncbi:MAG: pyridoxal phosphate-dependent aminotransferase [Bryobacteraceae bacterium]